MEYGCIGEKLGHSFSKIIHSKLTDYDYELKEIAKADLNEFMTQKDFRAINVTIPYKSDVIPFLDEISETARSIGAVNTIVNKKGKLYGYNTDFSGLEALILKNKIDIKNKKVLILGSGGTSKTAVAVVNHLAAKEVYVVSRRGSKECITYADAYEYHADAEIIINTTPCGMYPNIGISAVDVEKFPKLEAVADAVYNPLCSALVVDALNKGIKAVGGLYMLVSQAFFAAQLFLDKELNADEIDRIFREIEAEKQNIVLIGMPGCGKSTIGKILAKELDKAFIDTDEEIIKREKASIPEIFQETGEAGFRKIESEIVKEVSALQGKIIATGGGAVLNPDNVRLLKGNGIVIFLDRDINDIAATSDRPLSSNREDLEKRYKERYPIYCQAADMRIDCTNDATENANTIKEVINSENFSD